MHMTLNVTRPFDTVAVRVHGAQVAKTIDHCVNGSGHRPVATSHFNIVRAVCLSSDWSGIGIVRRTWRHFSGGRTFLIFTPTAPQKPIRSRNHPPIYLVPFILPDLYSSSDLSSL